MICPKCGVENPAENADCAKCGASLSEGLTLALPDDGKSSVSPEDHTVGLPQDRASAGTEGWSVPAAAADPQLSIPGQVSLEAGAVLAGRYEIVKMLGEGGMGAVYQAKDIELDRPVALKLIRPELATHPEILKRFKQELILARKVTHPNVVRIFDLATSGTLKFITMEFVEGQDLKSLIVEGHKFSAEETIDISVQICKALKAAHDAGVVHRDLKPQNIMLDPEGQAKVMDFGVARSMDTTGFTGTGQLIGTPDYMSPEQAKGEPVDARSDLFSFGIILYEMLIGETPYHSESTLGTLLKRTQERAVPPIKRDSGIPRYLNDVVVRCLEIETELRYQSAQEIADDLQARQASRTLSGFTRLRLRARRTRPATRWAAVVLAAAMVGLAIFVGTGRLSFVPRPELAAEIEPVSLAILPFRNSTGNPQIDWLQSSLAEMLRSDVGQSAHLIAVPSDRVHQIMSDLKLAPSSNLDAATISRLGTHSNAQLVVSGQYSKLGDQIRIDATLHDLDRKRSFALKAEAASEAELLDAIGELAQSIRENMDFSADVIRELETASFTPSSESIEALRFYSDGLQLERQGNYVEALAAFKRSTEADPNFALAHARLGQAYSNLGRDGEAERASRAAVELSEGLPDYERYLIEARHATVLADYEKAIKSYERLAEAVPEDPEINFSLADLYERTGALDQARERLQKVLKYDPNYVDALYALGRVELLSGNPQEALDPLNRGLTLAVQAENEDGRARMLNVIGVAYRLLGNLDEALRHYGDSLEIRRRLDQKSGIATSLSEIARVYRMQGNLEEAQTSLEEGLRLRQEIGDRAGIGTSLINLGGFHLDLGHHEEALRNYKDSLQIQREIGSEMDQAICLNNIGLVYLERGEFGDARTNFEQALTLRQKANIPYEIGETLHNLGETAAGMAQYDEAVDYYLRALEQMRAAQRDLGVAASLHGMGVILASQGRFRAALESHREAVDTLEKSGEEGYWLVVVTGRYGASLSAVGRFDEARDVLEKASALAEELQNQALVSQVLNFQGDNFYHRGELQEAASRFAAALRQASAADDPRAVLLSKLNVAKVAVRQARSQEAVATLEAVSREADGLGLKYEAAESSILLGEALLEQGDTAGARRRLESALTIVERSQMRVLLAQCRYLFGRVDQAAGDAAGASRHYAQARRILEEIREEAGEDDPLRRQDLQAIYAQAGEPAAES